MLAHSLEFPPEVSQILTDYSDIMPENLPNKLPSLRDIQYATDFMLGSSLPNLPYYTMNPTKHVELRRHVDELLRKDFARERLCPCVAPRYLHLRRMVA